MAEYADDRWEFPRKLRAYVGRLTVSAAIVVAAAIIGLSIVGASLVAPYRAAGGAGGIWRINTVTGEMQLCSVALPGSRCM